MVQWLSTVIIGNIKEQSMEVMLLTELHSAAVWQQMVGLPLLVHQRRTVARGQPIYTPQMEHIGMKKQLCRVVLMQKPTR